MENAQRYTRPIASEVLASIQGKDQLIAHLGHWPSFHDFEVVQMLLERPVISAADSDLKAVFLVFDGSRGVDDPERRQGTAEILFEGITDLRIEGFGHQNPVMGLSITQAGERIMQVAWGGTCMQHEVAFRCSRISIVRVVDLNPFRRRCITV